MPVKASSAPQHLMVEVREKTDNAGSLAKTVIENPQYLSSIIDGLSSSEGTVRFKCAKILSLISDGQPSVLYPHFDFFLEMLSSSNNILKWNAIDVLFNLAAVDSDNRFEAAYSRMYALLDEGNLITSAHVVENSDKLVRARPDWEGKITRRLLSIEKKPLPSEECRCILCGKVIQTFSRYAATSPSSSRMLTFARAKLNSSRAATKKKAEAFVKKYSSV